MILASYYDIHTSKSGTALQLISWRQLERTTIASYIILFAYLQSEALPEETQVYLNKALAILAASAERFKVAAEIRDAILSLGKASGMSLL